MSQLAYCWNIQTAVMIMNASRWQTQFCICCLPWQVCTNTHWWILQDVEDEKSKVLSWTKIAFLLQGRERDSNGFWQIDLQNREAEVAMCEDLVGNLIEFRSGDGRQQAKSVGYFQTGTLMAVCSHQVACTIIPMVAKGEKFFMLHAMLDFFEEGNYSSRRAIIQEGWTSTHMMLLVIWSHTCKLGTQHCMRWNQNWFWGTFTPSHTGATDGTWAIQN